MIPLLYESGLRSVFFGIETFNKKAGQYIGRAMDANKLKDTLHEIKNNCSDLLITAAFIIGLPGESWASIYKTVEWLESTKCPIDSYILNPLIDTGESKFTNSPEKYNMTYNKNGWKHDIMEQKEAQSFVNEMKSKKEFQTRNLLGIKDLKKSDKTEINKCEIIKNNMITNYYNKLVCV